MLNIREWLPFLSQHKLEITELLLFTTNLQHIYKSYMPCGGIVNFEGVPFPSCKVPHASLLILMLLKVIFTMFQCFREIENLREKWQDLISKLTVCSPFTGFFSKDG